VILRCRVRAAGRLLSDEHLSLYSSTGFESDRSSQRSSLQTSRYLIQPCALCPSGMSLRSDTHSSFSNRFPSKRGLSSPKESSTDLSAWVERHAPFPFRFGGQAFASHFCERRSFVEAYVGPGQRPFDFVKPEKSLISHSPPSSSHKGRLRCFPVNQSHPPQPPAKIV